MIQVVNKLTGEVYELDDHTSVAIRDSWLLLSETIKACERAKEKLKPKVDKIMAEQSVLPIGEYQFRRSVIERKNYDKSVMRKVLDADTFDLLLVPDKPRIDTFLKENLETLGDASTKLRQSMVSVGNPYTTLRLEKL